MRRWWLSAVALWLWGAASVEAQSVVVIVPPQLEPGVSVDQGERVVSAIGERLRADGYNIITPGQAASAMAALGGEEALPGKGSTKSAHDCTSEACAVAFRDFFDAELAAQITLYRRLDAGDEEASSLSVTLVESSEDAWRGRAGIANGDVEVAALQALTAARKRRAGGGGPMLTVEGTPEGARVFIDGRPAGALPYQGSVAPGTHEVEVRAPGLAAHSQQIHVRSDPDGEVRVEFDLSEPPAAPAPEAVAEVAGEGMARDAADAQLARALEEPTAAYDWVVGAGLVATGAVLAVVVPVATAVKSGQCTNGDSDRTQCPEIYDMDASVGIQAAVGAVLAAAGAVVMWKKPIQVMLGADRQSARLSVRGSF